MNPPDEVEQDPIEEIVDQPAHKALAYGDKAVNSGVLLAQAPAKKKKKRPPKKVKSSLHNVATVNVFMHVYFENLDSGYTDEMFFDYIVGGKDSQSGLTQYQLGGLDISLIKNKDTMAADFKSSLKHSGAIVVYFGHTVLGKSKKKTLGLTPSSSDKPAITSAELVNLLNKSKAKIVILAGCASDGCIRRLKGETIVVVTRSGKDRLTNTLQWAPAVKAFMDELVFNLGTAGSALDAANKEFKRVSSTDSFDIINGDRTVGVYT